MQKRKRKEGIGSKWIIDQTMPDRSQAINIT